MAIYLHVDGLEGDVTAAGHEGYLDTHRQFAGAGVFRAEPQ